LRKHTFHLHCIYNNNRLHFIIQLVLSHPPNTHHILLILAGYTIPISKAIRTVHKEYFWSENSLIQFYSPSSIKRPPIKRPPFIKRPLSKVPIHLSVNCYIWYLYSSATSIKRPRPPFCCRKCIIYMVFYLQRPANYLFQRNGDIWYKVITDNNKKTRTVIYVHYNKSYNIHRLSPVSKFLDIHGHFSKSPGGRLIEVGLYFIFWCYRIK